MFSKDQIKLAIAPIAWTNDDLPELGGHIPFEQCIDEMAEAGFSGSEIGNKYPQDPAVLKAALGKRGLQISSAWFSSFFSEEGLSSGSCGLKNGFGKKRFADLIGLVQ